MIIQSQSSTAETERGPSQQTDAGQTPDAKSTSVIRVVVVYEDHPARDRARDLCSRLTGPRSNDLEVQASWWQFALLGRSALRELAVQETVVADIVFFALGPAPSLPAEVKQFNEEWAAKRTDPEGLLAVLAPSELPSNHAAPLHHYFYNLAKRARVDYLSSFNTFRDGPILDEHAADSHELSLLTPLLVEAYREDSLDPRWGISEW